MHSSDLQRCRVCGYEFADFHPWGEDGRLASFDICPCCGVEFGLEDETPATTRAYRAGWLAKGAPWFDRRTPRDGLAVDERLARVPTEFR